MTDTTATITADGVLSALDATEGIVSDAQERLQNVVRILRDHVSPEVVDALRNADDLMTQARFAVADGAAAHFFAAK